MKKHLYPKYIKNYNSTIKRQTTHFKKKNGQPCEQVLHRKKIYKWLMRS